MLNDDNEKEKLYSYMIDRLAAQLQTHISALKDIEKSISLYDALRNPKEQKDVIESALQNLRELHQGIAESIKYLVDKAEGATKENLEDAEVLLEYFLEAAYKYEQRILKEVETRIGYKEELIVLNQLKSLVEKALDLLRSHKRV